LNQKSMTADNGWSSRLGAGGGLTTPNYKEPAGYEMLHINTKLR